MAGPLSVAPATLWRGVWEGSDQPGYLVVRDLRLPRILMAALVGAALASYGDQMRADAMFHSVVSGMSKDHILISCVTREAEIANALKRNLPNVKAVHVPHITCGGFMAVVSIKKTLEPLYELALHAKSSDLTRQ